MDERGNLCKLIDSDFFGSVCYKLTTFQINDEFHAFVPSPI